MKIIYEQPNGVVAIIIPAGDVQDAIKDVPAGTPYEIVEDSVIPSDRTFRNAWKKNGKAVETDVAKAKDICHEKRRAKRSEEFAPLDVKATIPAKAAQAEAARQAVRDKYDAIQVEIDAATTPEALKAIIDTHKLAEADNV